jgi:hypothetical protein
MGCASDAQEIADIQPRDYCDEIVELLDEFDAIASDGFFNDDSDSLESLVFNAKKISGLVLRAENEGVDLSSPDAEWFTNLRVSARAFITLAESDPNTFSDEELTEYLERILGWYDFAGEECRVVIA